MFASLFTAALLASSAAVFAADAPPAGLVYQNTTAAGSQITWPTENATLPINGTVYVKWDWKEESKEGTAPVSLMVGLVNANTTIFHPAGHAPSVTGLGGKGLFDMNKSVLANMTEVNFGPLRTPGDNSIKPGAGYHIVLGWPNTGADKENVPYLFMQSKAFNVDEAGPDQLPAGVKPFNAKPAAAGRVSVSAALAVAAIGAACLF